MDTILMEMPKMCKVTDGHMDDGQIMVNRPRHKLTWSKVGQQLKISKMNAVVAIVDIVAKWF